MANDELVERFASLHIGNQFATIDEIVEAMDAAELWSAERQAIAIRNWKKTEARRLIRAQRDATGWPLWFSVAVVDDEGNTQRVYARESLFDLEQYRQVIDYHKAMSIHHAATANELTRRARKRFKLSGNQLRLPFPQVKQ